MSGSGSDGDGDGDSDSDGDDSDSGVATVVAAGAAAVLVLLLLLVVDLGTAVASRHRAESAADAAALAGAAEGVRGRDVGCARAEAVAAANGGRLVDCVWDGWTLSVRTERDCACPLPAVSGRSTGRARAGPSGRRPTRSSQPRRGE